MKDNGESVDSGSDEEQNLGLLLQSARDSNGLTIEEIAAELRIEPRLLRALEEGRFEDLGAPVFAKGYLKQYGTRLGLDYKNLLSEYYRVVDSSEVEIAPSRTIKLRDERQITIWLIAAITVALLAVFLLIWWLNEPTNPVESMPTIGEQSTPAAAPAQPAPPPQPAARVANQSTNVASPAEPDPVGAQGAIAAAAPNVAPAGTANTSPAAPDDAEADVLAEDLGQQTLNVESTVAIELLFLEDCWTEVTDAQGERLFFGLGEAGARSRFAGQVPIAFLLGNADGVEIMVENRRFDIPPGGRRGDLARFTVAGAVN